MNPRIALTALLLVFAGCTTVSTAPGPSAQVAPSAQMGTNVYRGEVWTWDTAQSTVTLRQGAQMIRVQVTPDQLRTLAPHETATVRGQLLGPAEIATITVPTPPMTAVPRGAIERSEVQGTVAAVDPRGLLTIDSPSGRLTVWSAPDAESRYQAGKSVHVRTSVQSVDMIPLATAPMTGQAPAPAIPEPAASASVGSEPGDHAVVVGRITSVLRPGTIMVDSPRGPITVSVPSAAQHQPGGWVQVRTSISAAP